MVLAVLAGIGTYIAVNAAFGVVHSILCTSSQFMNMLLRVSYFAFPIRAACWAVAAWAGWSVGASMA
jgi:hypothetical protein